MLKTYMLCLIVVYEGPIVILHFDFLNKRGFEEYDSVGNLGKEELGSTTIN